MGGDGYRADRHLHLGNHQAIDQQRVYLYVNVWPGVVADQLFQAFQVAVVRMQATDAAIIFDTQINTASGSVGHAYHCFEQCAQRQLAQVALELVLQGFAVGKVSHGGSLAACVVCPVYPVKQSVRTDSARCRMAWFP